MCFKYSVIASKGKMLLITPDTGTDQISLLIKSSLRNLVNSSGQGFFPLRIDKGRDCCSLGTLSCSLELCFGGPGCSMRTLVTWTSNVPGNSPPPVFWCEFFKCLWIYGPWLKATALSPHAATAEHWALNLLKGIARTNPSGRNPCPEMSENLVTLPGFE